MHTLEKTNKSLNDRTLSLVAPTVLVLALMLWPTPAKGQCVGTTKTIDAGPIGTGTPNHPSTNGVQPIRLNRNGTRPTCLAPKVCPGTAGIAGDRNFDAYEFANLEDNTVCVEIDFTTGCDADFFAGVYLNAFDPDDLCANYLADLGASSDGVFSFEVPALTSFIFVVYEKDPGVPCAAYSFDVCGLIFQPDLSITKIEDPDPVVQNMPLTYTLTVANNSPLAADDVVVDEDGVAIYVGEIIYRGDSVKLDIDLLPARA